MGQFDSATDAVLTQLHFEQIAKTPGGEFAEIAANLLVLCGTSDPLSSTGEGIKLLQKIRGLAGASYASNLIYAVTAIRDDLKALWESNARFRLRIESLSTDPNFAEAISAVALRAMHTSVRDRLKRLARIVVNGVKEDDLNPEDLDEMMRAAVELNESDISLLKELCECPFDARRSPNMLNVYMDIGKVDKGRSDAGDRLGSVAKLQAVAFVQLRTPGVDMGASIVVLLPKGRRFYERLAEIAANMDSRMP